MKMNGLKAALIAASTLMSLPAAAADLTFSGNFAKDNDVLTFNFTIGTARDVQVVSSSWQSPNGGGFDPILNIFNSSGDLIRSQDDGGLTGSVSVNGTSYSYGVWDSNFVVSLAAGVYSAVVTQFDNFPLGGINSGYRYDSEPNFTFARGYGGATQPFFNGVWDSNDPRTSFWRFHLLNVDQVVVVDPNQPPTTVPEPMSLALFGAGLAGLAVARRRKA